jgi:hypothetical protein
MAASKHRGVIGAFLKALKKAGGTSEFLNVVSVHYNATEVMVAAGNKFLKKPEKKCYGAKGSIQVFLERFKDAGGTSDLRKLAINNPAIAKAMIEAGRPFLITESDFTYPDEYTVKPIAEQIAILSEFFGLNGTKALAFTVNLPELLEGSESYFAIPRWQAITRSYGEALEKVITLIRKSRKFTNHCSDEFDEKYLRQSERTKTMFSKLCEQQKGDIIIVPAQFGLRHRGKSVCFTLEVFDDNEFGLGTFAVACMLLTHPKREKEEPGAYRQLHACCAGDELAPKADGQFDHVPSFFGVSVELHIGDRWMHNVCDRFGSASGFVMQG